MRDLGLARRQFFGALILFIGSGALFFLLFWPQYQLFQTTLSQTQQTFLSRSAVLQQLPSLSAHNSVLWDKNIEIPLKKLATTTQTQVVRIQGDPALAKSVTQLSAPIKKIPVTVTVEGYYVSLQTFLDQLVKQYPFMTVRSVELFISDKKPLKPDESPILQGIIELDFYAVYSEL